MERYKDYFSFDTIRDNQQNVICYYVTIIGTIDQTGVATIRTDLRADGEGKMAFGQVTVHNRNKKLHTLLEETGARVRQHFQDAEGSVDVISYTAADWRADEAMSFEEGDRVLIQGKAYIRKNQHGTSDRLPELSITATGMFLLGHRRQVHKKSLSQSLGLVPQKD